MWNPGARWASDECRYSEEEIARVVRIAASIARGRRRALTSVDKANVLEASRLWRAVTTEIVEAEFPDLRLEHMLVDACAMHLLRRPADFDVIVTENMFGDILTDAASMLAGSIGALPSASLSPTHGGLYEPTHGSAPDLAGRGVANPIGAILSAALLLRHALRLETEAAAVEAAVTGSIESGIRTADLNTDGSRAVSTESVGRDVTLRVRQQAIAGWTESLRTEGADAASDNAAAKRRDRARCGVAGERHARERE